MSYILEKLYLGDLEDACKTKVLQDKGITHILTIDCKPLAIDVREGFEYKYVYSLDMETSDLLSHFSECLKYIEEGRHQGGVLVHCFAGLSRSAAVVLAYTMQKLDLNFDDALTLVMKQRPQIRPNPGFWSQLELFEAMGNTIDAQHEDFKKFRLRNLALKIAKAEIECLPADSLSADPTLSTCAGDTVYKCRKCRRSLFKQCCLLSHETGRGVEAFSWQGLQASAEGDDCDILSCEKSLFIEPVQWMGTSILAIEGKLSCPKCKSKLGSFNWSGERCPCGTWVTPAFHIQTSKVDESRPRPINLVVAPRQSAHPSSKCLSSELEQTSPPNVEDMSSPAVGPPGPPLMKPL